MASLDFLVWCLNCNYNTETKLIQFRCQITNGSALFILSNKLTKVTWMDKMLCTTGTTTSSTLLITRFSISLRGTSSLNCIHKKHNFTISWQTYSWMHWCANDIYKKNRKLLWLEAVWLYIWLDIKCNWHWLGQIYESYETKTSHMLNQWMQ